MHAYREAMAAYFTFAGRTGRASFWQYVLTVLLLSIVAHLADVVLKTGSLVYGVFCLMHVFPGLTVQVRRLHDVGRSGWWLLLCFTLVGSIPLLVWCCRKSQAGPNRYGLPAGVAASGDIGALPDIPTGSDADAPLVAPEIPSQTQPAVIAPRTGRTITPLHAVLVIVGIGAGLAGLADANGVRLFGSSAPQCSDRAVTDLVKRFMRENLARSELRDVVDGTRTGITLEAIRTEANTPQTADCAAHVKLDLAYTPSFSALRNAEAAGTLTNWRELEITYRAQLTDDGKGVYVGVSTHGH